MKKNTFRRFLIEFFDTDIGGQFLEAETTLIESALDTIFGRNLIQIGLISRDSLLKTSRVSLHTLIDGRVSALNNSLFHHQIEADLDYLPIATQSIDVVVLPHTFETVDDPYHLLRQVNELLAGEGSLVISGFNPHGWSILMRLIGQLGRFDRSRHATKGQETKNKISPSPLISAGQMSEWLKVLGYEIERIEMGVLPTESNGWKRKLIKLCHGVGLEMGSSYCITAKKRLSNVTMIGLGGGMTRWKASGSKVSVALPSVTRGK